MSKLAKKLIIIILFVVIPSGCCFLSELALQFAVQKWVSSQPKEQSTVVEEKPETIMIDTPTSGTKPSQIQTYAGYGYTVNSLGYRSDEIDVDIEEHWLFFGDSTTFGLNTPYEQIFTSRIQQNIDDDGLNAQVVNTARPGMGAGSELLLLRQLNTIEMLNPKVIVVGFYKNDVVDDQGKRTQIKLATDSFDFSDITLILANRLYERYLYQFVAATANEFSNIQLPQKETYIQRSQRLMRVDDIEIMKSMSEWQLTLDSLQRIYQLTQDNEMVMILLYLPVRDRELLEERDSAELLLQWFAENNEIPYLSGIDVYLKYLEENGYFTDSNHTIPDDLYSYNVVGEKDLSHMGVLGHELLADAIYDKAMTLLED